MQTELITAEQSAADISHVAPDQTALTDLRQLGMSLPPEHMKLALGAYAERRQTFREWLLSQMQAGVHYGVIPGCEPKFDEKGNLLIKSKGGFITVRPDQWRHKPSLYKAGAEFVIDLMGLRQEYEADAVGWQQLGSKPGMFVYKCRLISRASGEPIGEGIGCGVVGAKYADENKACKDAQKRAMVAAVLNSYGLSDLFTQDEPPPPNENPESGHTPSAQGRATPGPRLVTAEQVKFLVDEWKERYQGDFAAWEKFVLDKTGRIFDVKKASNWTHFDYDSIREALCIPTDEELANEKP